MNNTSNHFHTEKKGRKKNWKKEKEICNVSMLLCMCYKPRVMSTISGTGKCQEQKLKQTM